MWKPTTVEDIRKWLAGEYVLNPSPEEYWKRWLAEIRRLTPLTRRSRKGKA